MLHELDIENYAVVEKLRVGFHAGLNLLTGETGSGKSIVVDSLALLFGERAGADLHRDPGLSHPDDSNLHQRCLAMRSRFIILFAAYLTASLAFAEGSTRSLTAQEAGLNPVPVGSITAKRSAALPL